jgi:asparagine synthase (glutamine-hydrolysing)
MCRIAGIINYGNDIDILDLGRKMRDALSHGGPDDFGEYLDIYNGVYLGHRRLSVIDTSSAGHQPMRFENLIIVYNGEIYNFKEIASELSSKGHTFESQSDTEIILKSFREWGKDAVMKYRGMFVFAIWNTLTQTLTICRDRVGVKPLYWYNSNGVFLFSSELKSFRLFSEFNKDINHSAVSLFLQTGYIPSPYTIYQDAHKIEPGSFLEFNKHDGIQTWKYWDINNLLLKKKEHLEDVDVLYQAEQLLIESCNYRMISDVPIGVFLSGGIDSTLVTSILQSSASKSIRTYTVGFESKKIDESNYARKIANFLGTDHTEVICTREQFKNVIPSLPRMFDEPFGDSSAIPTHLISYIARKEITVALSADGGDEVFGGYSKYRVSEEFEHILKYIPYSIRYLFSKGIYHIDFNKLEKYALNLKIDLPYKGLEWKFSKFANAISSKTTIEFFEKSSIYQSYDLLLQLHKWNHESILNKIPHNIKGIDKDFLYSTLGILDIQTYLEGDILTKVDRASMYNALETREPLLDHKLIEFGISLPDRFKIRNGQSKWILRKILSKYVPYNLVNRPKQGFAIPIDQWLKGTLREYLLAIPLDTKFADLFMLDIATLKNIISSYLSNDKRIDPHFIWFLYILYSWYLEWI